MPGSLDKYLPEYGMLCFVIGALASWPASNNAALFAEASIDPLQHRVLHTCSSSIALHSSQC